MLTLSSPSTNRRFSRRYWWRLMLFTVILIIIALLALLVYFIDRQIYVFTTPVRQTHLDLPPEIEWPLQDITLTTRDSLRLSAWYVPGSKSEAIILVHGIHANRLALLPQAIMLHEAGYHLLLLDLRGHGLSEGNFVTYGHREALDVQAAADYLMTRPSVERMGIIGTSMGGAAVVRAAALDPRLEAIVIESSYSSLPDAVEDAFDDLSVFPRWPFAPLLIALAEQRVGVEINQVDSARELSEMQPRPLLIIHGQNDQLFPPDHAQRLYAAAHEPKTLWIIDTLGHDNPALNQGAIYQQRLLTFFESAFAE